jgi:hypothetical protein
MAKKPSWVTPFHLNGNDVADKLADVAANTYEVPSSIAIPIIKNRKLVLAIQRRLVVILMSLPARPAVHKPVTAINDVDTPKPPSVNPDLGHDIVERDSYLFCNGCYRSAAKRSSAAKSIFTRVCIPPPDSHLSKPVNVSLIHTGIHHSHIMAVYKGLYHCTKCGSLLGKRIVKLGSSCMPPSVAGKRNLDCIHSNKFPQGVSIWPSDNLALPKCTPSFASQSSIIQPHTANRSWAEQVQQHNASVRVESSLAKVAASSMQVASVGAAASSSSTSLATNSLTPTIKSNIVDDSSGSD